MFTREELLTILIALNDSLRREEEHRPNGFWLEDIVALRDRVRGLLKAQP